MKRSLSSTVAAALVVTYTSVATGASPEDCMAAIALDIKASGAVPQSGGSSWTKTAIPTATTDLQQINYLVDEPLVRGAITHTPLSKAVDYILQYRRLPLRKDVPVSKVGIEKYKTLLQTPVNCPNASGHGHVSRPCTVTDAYSFYRDRWLRAVSERDGATTAGANEMRGAQVERARYDWDRKGYRQAVTIALAQIRFRDQLDPELVWNQLERNFLEFGGAAYRRFGLRPPIKTDPPLPLKDGSPIRWQMASMTLADGGGATVQIPYIMVRILREWFDPIMLWRLRWGWDRAAPLGSAFRFSNGRSCSTDSALPCVVEWLIVVREDAPPACTNSNGLSGVSHVIGLSGEVLPQLPWFIETGRIFISGEEQIGRAYSIDYVRQRLAVRSF